jgi:hypothetical protein
LRHHFFFLRYAWVIIGFVYFYLLIYGQDYYLNEYVWLFFFKGKYLATNRASVVYIKANNGPRALIPKTATWSQSYEELL